MINNFVNRMNSTVTSTLNSVSKPSNTWFAFKLLFLVAVLSTIGGLMYYYWHNITNFFNGLGHKNDSTPPPVHMPPVHMPPAEENIAPHPSPIQSQIVENALPQSKQVFSISSNKYTYYDAEPLCKALGAELATYDQLKEAYDQGGDWCNYGWVQGQMALYPTQEETWLNLQKGPEEQRMSCGKVGLNGGYFDNPELRFGVNCYGSKPAETTHDASLLTNGEDYPMTPEMIEFDKKVSKYKSVVDTIGILPFSSGRWSE
jgi:hypothetical protein